MSKKKSKVEIRITKTKDGRFFAQYINPRDFPLGGIGQFGKTEFEAKINLEALLKSVREQMLKTNVIRHVEN